MIQFSLPSHQPAAVVVGFMVPAPVILVAPVVVAVVALPQQVGPELRVKVLRVAMGNLARISMVVAAVARGLLEQTLPVRAVRGATVPQAASADRRSLMLAVVVGPGIPEALEAVLAAQAVAGRVKQP